MSSRLDDFYQSSPVWLQQIMVGGYGWWWYRQRYNAFFHQLVDEYNSRERWNAAQFQTYQELQLRNLFTAASRSPYYRQVLDESDVWRGDDPFVALKRLPYLSKETLRTRPADLLTQRPSRRTKVFKSSGTTGTPTEIYYPAEFHALEVAIPAARNLAWAGVNYRQRRVMFGVRKVCRFDQGKPPFWRYSPVENMTYASIYHLSPEHLPAYINFLNEFRPDMIMGYPNALAIIARFALETGRLPAPAKAIFTTSETVTDQLRTALEKAWQCKVFDRYAAVEGCMFASQCEYGKYHVSPEVGMIEIVDENGKECAPGVPGEVIVTGLQNMLQPLIRYRIGDVAQWASDQSCQCGRSMPILEGIEGRIEDMCTTPDGRKMLRFDTVFKGITRIKEAQVVQEALDRFVIYIVPGNGFDNGDISHIKENMKLHAGNVHTDVQKVEKIARTSSGKFRAVICKVH